MFSLAMPERTSLGSDLHVACLNHGLMNSSSSFPALLLDQQRILTVPLGFGPESWRLAMGGAEDTDQLQHMDFVRPLLDALSTVSLFFSRPY